MSSIDACPALNITTFFFCKTYEKIKVDETVETQVPVVESQP